MLLIYSIEMLNRRNDPSDEALALGSLLARLSLLHRYTNEFARSQDCRPLAHSAHRLPLLRRELHDLDLARAARRTNRRIPAPGDGTERNDGRHADPRGRRP